MCIKVSYVYHTCCSHCPNVIGFDYATLCHIILPLFQFQSHKKILLRQLVLRTIKVLCNTVGTIQIYWSSKFSGLPSRQMKFPFLLIPWPLLQTASMPFPFQALCSFDNCKSILSLPLPKLSYHCYWSYYKSDIALSCGV